jgi:hypothetical protein
VLFRSEYEKNTTQPLFPGLGHFGVVWLVKLAEPNVTTRGERGIGKLSLRDLASLSSMRDRLESWSQLLVDYLRREDASWQD